MRSAKLILLLCFFGATAVFSAISSTPRTRTWVTNGEVDAIVPIGDKVYIGGTFTSVGPADKSTSVTRNHIACFDTTTGTATAWDPNVHGSGVTSLSVSGAKVYVGGGFDTIGGQQRSCIACLDTGTALATAWDPNANGAILSLSVNGAKVYVGGYFDNIGGQKRKYIACLDTGTGLATTWNAGAPTSVTTMIVALSVNGANVYVGGYLGTSIGGQTRKYCACLDTGTALATAWNPNPNSYVYAISANEDKVYLGGSFTSIRGVARNGIACVDTTAGTTTGWNPDAGSTGGINSVILSGANVYAGGAFSTIGGQTRNGIACLDTGTGLATSWNPNANDAVYVMAANGAKVYVGGIFTTIGGIARPNFAEFDDVSTAAINTTTGEPSGSIRILSRGFSGGGGIISYNILREEQVSVRIYDIKGRVLASAVNQAEAAGSHTVRLSSDGLSSGLYLLKFRAGAFEKTQSITIMR